METLNSDYIVVKDQTIIAFYKENPNLDFNTMNHIFIDILKKLSTNLNETITKLHETKKEYIDNIKLIIDNSTMTTNDKIHNILEKNNEYIVSKTTSIINEILPKNNNIFINHVDNKIKQLYDSINHDTNKLIDNIKNDDTNISEFINSIDAKFNNMIGSIQQPIFSFIQSSEEIKKFERDLKLQKQHGNFISHKSNITYKEPFQFDIIDNLIVPVGLLICVIIFSSKYI
jgi:methyl-accepting chemotaxis protein